MMSKQSLESQSFGDFLKILRSRGLGLKADLYLFALTFECMIRHISNPLELSVADALHIIKTPPTPPGWNHFYWGKAA